MDRYRSFFENLSEKLDERIAFLKSFSDPDDDRSLRCRRNGKNVYFSVRGTDDSGRVELYVPKAEINSYKKLARKNFARKTVPVMEKDLKAIDRFLSAFSWKDELLMADSIDPELIKLCGNGFDSRTTFIDKWLSQTWSERPLRGDPPNRPAISGHVVRSKSEEFIDNALFNHGLPFFYEKPLYLPGLKYPKFPDFTILDPATLEEIYWEHLGMMDDPAYADANCRKMTDYIRSGLYPGPRFIVTFETSAYPLSSLDVESIINKRFPAIFCSN